MDIKSVPTPFLYLGLGKVKYQRKKMLQVFGCSNSLSGVMSDRDVRLIAKEREVWLGIVSSSEIRGQTYLADPPAVHHAKSIYQKALKFRNTRFSTSHDLVESAEVFNRWWSLKSIFARKASPHIDWPDVIIYHGLDEAALTMKLSETHYSVINSTHLQKVETLPPHLKHWE